MLSTRESECGICLGSSDMGEAAARQLQVENIRDSVSEREVCSQEKKRINTHPRPPPARLLISITSFVLRTRTRTRTLEFKG